MTKQYYPATLLTDFYKLSHREQYPIGTEVVYSTFTPRSNRYFPLSDKVVVFGIQAFIKEYLMEYFDEHFFSRSKQDIVKEYTRIVKHTLGQSDVETSHLEELHDLGYLPIRITALKEGTLAPIKTPVLTIENTQPKFFWLTNYLETLMSNEIWMPMTSATISHQYRKILNEYALKTTGNTDGVEYQAHDFSMRGMSSLGASKSSGAGHLLSFVGTDMIPAILYHEHFYSADVESEVVGTSLSASEHATMSANTSADGDRDEYEAFKRLITEVYPSGMVSVVSDTYDFFRVIGETLPKLKNEIMNRDGKLIIRPDSGIPEDILCGKNYIDLTHDKYIKNDDIESLKKAMERIVLCNLENKSPHGEYVGDGYGEFKYKDRYYKVTVEPYWGWQDKQRYYIDGIYKTQIDEFIPSLEDKGLIESLYDLFGGTVNKQGYKVLDSHIGAIYGDSITLERCEDIVRRLEEKGFASTNVVLGIGSYSFQMNTRDTFGFAMKATYAVVNGEERMLFKDPKTDDGTKRSQRGRVGVFKNTVGNIVHADGYNKEENEAFSDINLLETVFEDGKLIRDQSLSEIREILKSQNKG